MVIVWFLETFRFQAKLLRPHLTLFGILVPILESSSIYMNL